MKKLILLFILSGSLMSCTKDNEEPTVLSVEGTWKVQSHVVEYYKAGNVKDYEEVLTNDPDAMDRITFTGNAAVITSNNNIVEKSNFTLTAENGKNYIRFINPNISDVDKIEVSVSGKEMNFLAEAKPAAYIKNGQNMSATKVILRIKFAKA